MGQRSRSQHHVTLAKINFRQIQDGGRPQIFDHYPKSL